mmetsp:Transcript_51908/g.159950  ORF Transcript_51908/g.159950 Transcript_51908/m.159950 type:complete len:505 (+) Transcript_51908:332-1846(+)
MDHEADDSHAVHALVRTQRRDAVEGPRGVLDVRDREAVVVGDEVADDVLVEALRGAEGEHRLNALLRALERCGEKVLHLLLAVRADGRAGRARLRRQLRLRLPRAADAPLGQLAHDVAVGAGRVLLDAVAIEELEVARARLLVRGDADDLDRVAAVEAADHLAAEVGFAADVDAEVAVGVEEHARAALGQRRGVHDVVPPFQLPLPLHARVEGEALREVHGRPRRFEDVRRRRALRRVARHERAAQVVKLLAVHVSRQLLGRGRRVVAHRVEDLVGGAPGERALQRDELVDEDAERPHVGPGVVRPLLEHLRREALRGADARRGEVGGVLHAAGEAEVGELDRVTLEEDVLGFEVTVENVLRVAVVERQGHLHNPAPDRRLGERGAGAVAAADDGARVAARAVLEHDERLTLRAPPVEVAHDVAVAQRLEELLLHDGELVHGEALHLDDDAGAGLLHRGEVGAPESAAAEQLLDDVLDAGGGACDRGPLDEGRRSAVVRGHRDG